MKESGSPSQSNPDEEKQERKQYEEVRDEPTLEHALGFSAAMKLRLNRAKTYVKFQSHQLHRELDLFTSIQLIAVLVLFMIFLILPISYVMVSAFQVDGEWSLFWLQYIFYFDKSYFPFYIIQQPSFSILHQHPIGVFFEIKETPIIFDPEGLVLVIQGVDMGIIMNSIYTGLLTTLFSTLLGVSLAFIMARFDFHGKAVLRTLLLVPLLAIPFVGAIGVKRLLSVDGSLNLLFHEVLHIWPTKLVFEGFGAVILVQTLHFFSLTYLSAYSAFINIDPTLEESAENLGAKGFTLFRKVTLPLALPGIEAGAILTFIMSIEDLGTLVIFAGSPQVRKTLTFAIFNNIFSPTGEVEGVALAMGLVLLIIAAVGFFFIRKYMSLRHYAMLSKGGTWNPRLTTSKWYHYIIIYGFIISLMSVALIPHVGIILLAFAAPGSWGRTVLPNQFTIANFGIVFIDPDIFGSIANSLIYSGVAVIIIILVGTSAAYIVARKNIPGRDWLDLLVTIPIALPGIVIAVGYLLFFSMDPFFSQFLSPIISGAPAMLITMSYAVRKMPFTVRSTFAGLQQTHVELEEAASNLGASRIRVFGSIVLPLIGVSILAGGMMSFVYCMSEVSTSLVLGDIAAANGPLTWKMYVIYNALAMGPSLAAVMGIFLMILQIIVMATTNVILKKQTSALVGL
jgi:iron(III) transport system permease protein